MTIQSKTDGVGRVIDTVIVVESAGAMRATFAESLRKIGVHEVRPVASLATAIEMIEVDGAGWVVATTGTQEDVNVFHLLDLFANQPSLNRTLVSVIVDEKDLSLIPFLFQQGAISVHQRTATMADWRASVDEVWKRLIGGESPAKIAADNLRAHLLSAALWPDLERLERSLLSLFPADVGALRKLAYAQERCGKVVEAGITKAQADMLESASGAANEKTIDRGIAALTANYGDADLDPPANVLDLQSCLIVDPDESMRFALRQVARSLGCPVIATVESGLAADEWMKINGAPGLLLTEWRIAGVTTSALIQRISAPRYRLPSQAPIVIVTSSLVDQAGLAIINEMGVAAVVKKPVGRTGIMSAIIQAVCKDRLPSDVPEVLRAFRSATVRGDRDRAARERQRLFTIVGLPDAIRRYVDGEWHYMSGSYAQAKEIVMGATGGSSPSFAILSLLGKILLKLKDFEAAEKILSRAQSLSPMNVDRLCMIAEAQVEIGDLDGAKSKLLMAHALDPDLPQAIAVVENLRRKLETTGASLDEALSSLASGSSLFAYHNNCGVAFAKTGKLDESIDCYRKASMASRDNQSTHSARASIAYNLGLSLCKGSRLDEAVTELEFATGCAPDESDILEKAESLLNRVRISLETGRPIVFSTTASDLIDEINDERWVGDAQSRVTERALLGIFVSGDAQWAAMSKNFLLKRPRFFRRSVITKDGNFFGVSPFKAAGE